MRVIHVACVAPPETGGMGAVAFEEVKMLRARGLEALLIAPRGGGVEGVLRVPAYWSIGNAAALNLHSITDDLRTADIVHLHYPFYGTAGQLVRLRRNGGIKRLVMTLHMDATADGWKGALFDAHRRWFQREILDAADALLVSSKDYARHSSFALVADRTIELPFGVDEKTFFPEATSVASRRILHVGGMDRAHAFKGVSVLLEALALLPSDVICELVGDGDLRPEFEQLAHARGLADRVIFSGRVDAADLAAAYRRAGIFAFPSTSGAEAFGLAALEAQASGVPVVASNLPGVRTVVSDGETGFLVAPNDPRALADRLQYLLDHPDVRSAMCVRARARVLERFTWSRHLDGLLRVYHDVCALRS